MTRRQRVLEQAAAPVAERIRRIESTPLPRNIAALLDAAARDVPDAQAWVFIGTGESITYRALRDEVNRLANGMRAAGVRAQSHVAVMLPNIPAMPTTWLALARIGAVIVPVNVRYTGHELHYTLQDSDADFLVIHADYLGILKKMPEHVPGIAGRIVVVGGGPGEYARWQDLLAKSDAEFSPDIEPAPDDLMNIQYTSGTTGLPKGCLLTHRYWLTCAKAYSACDFRTYKRILAGNPFFYMTPQWQLLMAFFQRGTLYVAPRLSTTHYVEWIREHKIDFCLFREAYYREPPAPLDADNEIVRVNIYGCRKEVHADMERRFDFVVRSAFGMTEIGIGTFVPLEAVEMTGSGSCGICAPFRECRIADPHGNTVADGQQGELLVRGAGILKGYYKRPQATAAAFHGDWFRTGDVAYRDARGFFYIVGRLKEMIKRAGENVAANEVEAVIGEIPGIAEVAVVAVPDELRGEEVKAYVTLADGVGRAELTPERIVALCSAKLAVFKIPRYIEYRDAPLPRTPSGKIRKQTLMTEKADLRDGSWDRLKGCRN